MRYVSPILGCLSNLSYYGEYMPSMLIRLQHREYDNEEISTIKEALADQVDGGYIDQLVLFKSIVISWKERHDYDAGIKFKKIHHIINKNRLQLTAILQSRNGPHGFLSLQAFCPSLDYEVFDFSSTTDMYLSPKLVEFFK